MSGSIIGMIAITPAAGYVEPWAAIVIGFSAALIIYLLSFLKMKIKDKCWGLFENDVLDVFLCHGMAGKSWELLLT